ncbi:SAGA complex component [Cordyceps javanica]|nr:SAGA complex component [Cordyceps javanica]
MHRSLYRNPTPTGALSASSTTRLARYVDCPTTPHHPARDIHHISSLNSHIHRLPSRAAASALISFRLSAKDSAKSAKKDTKGGTIKLKKQAPKHSKPGNWRDGSVVEGMSKKKSVSSPAASVASPGPVVNQLDDDAREAFATGRPLEDSPDLQQCKHCKKSILKTATKAHIAACLKLKKEKAQRKKEAREARERAKEAAREEEARKAEDKDDDDSDDDDDKKGGKRAGKKPEEGKGKKRKADGEPDKAPKAKKKKDEPKAKVPKPKGNTCARPVVLCLANICRAR